MDTQAAVANTIIAQLGGRRFLAMTGARDLIGYPATGALSMRLPIDSLGNYCKITLNGRDLYDLELGRVGRAPTYGYTVLDTREDVYGDDLSEVFADLTGLETSLGTLDR